MTETSNATTAARASLDTFIAAFNGRDLAAVRASCHYPHVLVSGGRVVVANSGEELRLDFDDLVASEGWDHSTFDDIEVVDAAPSMVALAFNYTRYHADGTSYRTGRAHYIFTSQDGRWGRQGQLLFN
ncbi:MAG: hypothetical protein JF603_15230 [Acidobacteria bacterium]|nr:hypothetical protein [Acidobacteriota bacterium]